MKRLVSTISAILFCSLALFAQEQKTLVKKQLQIFRTDSPIKIDGVLDEAIWQKAAVASDFTTLDPVPGNPAYSKTEVRLLYDNSALYIGAFMKEPSKDSIALELSQRDDFGNTDWFGVFLSPYNDGINGVGFISAATGVQFDEKYSDNGNDDNWDSVWENEVSITEEGWYVEFRIPFSALRFPNEKIQTWGINFGRMQQRTAEKTFWDDIDPQGAGFLVQWGELLGIKDIKSPVRLQATPYVSAYVENRYDKNGDPKSSNGYSYNGGMDVKYGINDAFTLDMTLIPDFGQVQSDDQVLNLSPFEVRFNENRAFFTEGTELFNKGNLFYSRRVGGFPVNYSAAENSLQNNEEITANPSETSLYNATKISGRTNSGLGIGLFNAVSAPARATIKNTVTGEEREVETSPLTNYNVIVFDQNLKNNSYIALVNTSVIRDGSTYDANVTGIDFDIKNKKNDYGISGDAALSQIYNTDIDDDFGYKFNFRGGKISGNFTSRAYINVESKNYNPNDLGFLRSPNEVALGINGNYGYFKPLWNKRLNLINSGYNIQRSSLYSPNEFTSLSTNLWVYTQTKSQWDINVWTGARPIEGYDFFEARTEGRVYNIPSNWNVGFWTGSDGRKKYRIELNAQYNGFSQEGRRNFGYSIEQRYRFNNKLSSSWSLNQEFAKGNEGFVNNYGDDIIFGRRSLNDITNVIRMNYIFSSTMNLTFRARHKWVKVNYDSYHLLGEDGYLHTTDYMDDHDQIFNAFNIDMVYTWRFAPGSDMIIVWKNSILNGEEGSGDMLRPQSYLDNVRKLGDIPQTNSLSIKIVYFLDYVNFRKK